jgi:hypothetical protein
MSKDQSMETKFDPKALEDQKIRKEQEAQTAQNTPEDVNVNAEEIKSEIVPMPDVTTLAELRNKTHGEKLAALQQITSYVGAQSERIDNYLGQRLELTGAFIHACTVCNSDRQVDKITGEIEPEYLEGERTVLKCHVNGQDKVFSFVSMAAAGWVKTFIYPLFGIGDLDESIPIIVRQQSNARGRTYNFEVPRI